MRNKCPIKVWRSELKKLKKEIKQLKLIKLRNKSCRIAVVVLTYVFVGFYMWSIGVQRPWLNAIIPVLGFLFSVFFNFWFEEGLGEILLQKIEKSFYLSS